MSHLPGLEEQFTTGDFSKVTIGAVEIGKKKEKMESGYSTDEWGNKRWYKPGTKILHRVDGPAVEWANGEKEWWQNNKRHRVDGPAIEYADGDKEWWQDNELHRLDGPAVVWVNGYKEWWIEGEEYWEEHFNCKVAGINKESETEMESEYEVSVSGTKRWYKPGTRDLHRVDGPAVVWPSGLKEWYQNGKRHRVGGPAIVRPNGTKEWHQNDQLHRVDGPAREGVNGSKEYFIAGLRYTMEGFNRKVAEMNKESEIGIECGIGPWNKKCWYKPGTRILHRVGAPAVVWASGSKEWRQNDQLHRVDGPAVKCANGDKFWYENDKLHRVDGPAREFANGEKEWYIQGWKYDEEAFNRKVTEMNNMSKESKEPKEPNPESSNTNIVVEAPKPSTNPISQIFASGKTMIVDLPEDVETVVFVQGGAVLTSPLTSGTPQ